jgi:hypothetical protein
MKRLVVLAATAAAMAGCGGDSSGPSNGNNTGSAFDITIGGGRNPTYAWPGGTAFSVSVVRVSAPGTIVWGVANTAMTIPSPVTHGTNPGGGTLVSANTEPTLTSGTRYRVAITRNDQKTGFREFTP